MEGPEPALRAIRMPAAVRWGLSVRIGRGEPIEAGEPAAPLATASVGKVLLLIHLARALASGAVDARERLERLPGDAVADSGLWQHMAQNEMSVEDLAVLVGAVSDNLATNVLLRRLTLAAVDETRESLGLGATRLTDGVRNERGPGDPPGVSTGSARELRELFERLRAGDGPMGRAAGWLRPGCDLSMVASAFGLDPLAHAGPDRGFTVVNKTGTNAGVRADAGWAEGPGGVATYAVVANWEPGDDPRDAVLGAMGEAGAVVRAAVS